MPCEHFIEWSTIRPILASGIVIDKVVHQESSPKSSKKVAAAVC